MGMFEPAEGINYNFILGMYLFFLSLGSLFLALEFAFKVEAVQGFYLIFAPFVPALLWHAAPRLLLFAADRAADRLDRLAGASSSDNDGSRRAATRRRRPSALAARVVRARLPPTADRGPGGRRGTRAPANAAARPIRRR